MAHQQRNNNVPPPPPPKAGPPSMPDMNLTKYGEGMSVTGNPNKKWSYRNGDNNMRYIHADSETDFTVKGQLLMSRLTPGIRYRGVFELELTSDDSGWRGDFVVSLEVPGSCRAVEACSYKCDKIGAFKLESRSFELAARPQGNARLGFSLAHVGARIGNTKCIRNGLTVKRFVIKKA